MGRGGHPLVCGDPSRPAALLHSPGTGNPPCYAVPSMKRRIVILAVVLFLAGVVTVAWTLAGLPPAKYHLRYGLDPYCAPTGETLDVEGVTFVEIGPGIFLMGSTANAEGGDWLGKLCKPFGLPWGKHPEPSVEMPVRWVEFRRGFWIATTEITNAQYERLDKDHQRHELSKGDDTPVVEVSWQDAKDYCTWLTAKAKRPIRLPSESEWECACRAGSEEEFAFGDDEEILSEYAWYDENSEGRAHAVGTKRPNRWGLFDLHGNVWEWCEDTWHDSYKDAPNDGTPWVKGGTPRRVRRGGSWYNPAGHCRSAHRNRYPPAIRDCYLGFRPAFSNPEPK